MSGNLRSVYFEILENTCQALKKGLESCWNVPKPSKVLLTLINRERLEQN